MIQPMLKYSFLVFHSDYRKFLLELRRLGVMHVIEKQKDVPTEIRDKYEHIKDVDAVIRFLTKREITRKDGSCSISGAEAFDIVKNGMVELEQKQQMLNGVRKEISLVEPWGNFSNDTIQKLLEKRIKLRFYTISSKKFEQKWLQEYPIEIISHHAGQVYFVMVEKGYLTEEIPGAEEMRAPDKPLAELIAEKEIIEKEIQELNALFDKHAEESMKAIDTYHKQMVESAQFDTAIMHTAAEVDKKVMLIEGWIPEQSKTEVTSFLDEKNVVYLEEAASAEENVPIQLKNNKFSRLFEPIGEFYELPNHRELDLVPFFAPFYMMFFGFSLGDAGYGLLIILAAGLAKRKLPEYKSILSLAQFLGGATVLFGILTGTFFGINLIEAEVAWLTTFKRFMIDETQLFNLALILGVIQIIFGMMVKVVNITRVLGFRYALSTVGWLILLIGGGLLYVLNSRGMIPEVLYTYVLYSIFGVSGLLIFIFNHPKRNVFMNFGLGIWDTYGMLTGLLGDLLSYLRLFALGVSSAILGMVFNSMALSMKPDNIILGPIVMILILVFGHGITLFMATLGAFVHPIRLTFVEFYKNAGFTGGGKKYQPFKKLI
jgi:V/A-type H+/Na+-transporting ATPase subunit I